MGLCGNLPNEGLWLYKDWGGGVTELGEQFSITTAQMMERVTESEKHVQEGLL